MSYKGYLIFFLLVGSRATFAQDQPISCGNPPARHTEHIAQYENAWKELRLSSGEKNIGIAIPGTDSNLFSSNDKQDSTQSTESTTKAYKHDMAEYFGTDASVKVAECGYRLCMLQRQRTSEAVVQGFTEVCESGNNPTSTIRITNPVQTIVVKEGSPEEKHTLRVNVLGIQQTKLNIQCESDRLICPQQSGMTNINTGSSSYKTLKFDMKLPAFANLKKGEPKTYTYYLTIGNETLLGGVRVLKDTSSDPNCLVWRNDSCVECGFAWEETKTVPRKGRATILNCRDMQTGPATIELNTTLAPTQDGLFEVEFGLGYGTSGSAETCEKAVNHIDPNKFARSYDNVHLTTEIKIPIDGKVAVVGCVGSSAIQASTMQPNGVHDGIDVDTNLLIKSLRVKAQ
jgi:hypothetical protein